MEHKKNILIGICGGSCAGKTSFANLLQEKLSKDRSVIISQDWYYHDQSQRFDKDGGAVNFDHPDSIDFQLMRNHLLQLTDWQNISAPVYDFTTHSRIHGFHNIKPKNVIIIDGTLILSQHFIVELLNYIVFLDIPEAIRLQRRLHRDVSERGRTTEGIIHQFENQVKPMHQLFVEPFKSSATHIITESSEVHEVLDILKKNTKE